MKETQAYSLGQIFALDEYNSETAETPFVETMTPRRKTRGNRARQKGSQDLSPRLRDQVSNIMRDLRDQEKKTVAASNRRDELFEKVRIVLRQKRTCQ